MFGSIFSSTAFALFSVSRRGVPFVKPSFPFGNFKKAFLQKVTIGEEVDEFYRSTTEPFIGVYGLFRPTLIACSPEFIRKVLIKDFQHFVDRGVYVDEKNDPISGHLFALEGTKWKNLRTKLTPTFTSGKMKGIFSTLIECKHPLQSAIENVAKNGETVEIREVTARYTTNAIASVAFGIDIDCFADPDHPFRRCGRQFFDFSWRNVVRMLSFTLSPKLLPWTGLKLLDREVEDFLYDLVKQTLELREKNNIVRKDFFQLLVQLRNSGSVQLDDEWQTIITSDSSKKLSIDELTAQAFIFWGAGFETSSSTMSFCLYEIAKNPDVQSKIQEELDAVLVKHEGKLTYESITELKYLECCIDEALRKYPVVAFLNRECTKDYKVPDSDVTIEKGTAVFIPVYSLHRDEKFYPDPEKFDPSRFFSENRSGKTILDMPYLPFGDGPRNCIGLRMGKMSTKMGIAAILEKYNVELGDEHKGEDELTFSPAGKVLTPTKGIFLKVSRR